MQTSSRRQLALRLLGVHDASPPPPPLAPPVPPTLESLVLARATFGATKREQARIAQLGVTAWLDEQLNPDAIADDFAERQAVISGPAHQEGAADLRMLIRAVHSNRQLAWRMTHFLNNHFSTFEATTQPVSEVREDEALRDRCFDLLKFPLQASAKSPAMIDYLDSGSNVAGNPNENYARELLELHTMGVDGGYTEPDVAEVARVFTGWRRVNETLPGHPVKRSWFEFDPGTHDSGPKTTSFGWSTPGIAGANGHKEGENLLAFLTQHASTADYFCTKLCRYFVSDDPPPALLSRVKTAFAQSGGHLGTTVRALFLDPDFATASMAGPKALDGFEFCVRIMRRVQKFGFDAPNIRERIGLLRSLPHRFAVPTGYPEVGPAWHGPNQLLPRWQFADDLAHDRVFGTEIDIESLFVAPTANPTTIVAALEELVCEQPLPAATKWALEWFLTQRLQNLTPHPPWSEVQPHAQDTLALMLQLPELHMH